MQNNLVLTDQTYLYDFSYRKRVYFISRLFFGSSDFKIIVFGFIDENKKQLENNLSVINLTVKSTFLPKSVRLLISIIRTKLYLKNIKSVILVENLLSALPLLLTKNIDFALDLHGDVVDELRLLQGYPSLVTKILYLIEDYFLKKSCSISVCSQNHKKAIEYRLGVNHKKITVVPNIADILADNPNFYDKEFEEFVHNKISLVYSGSSLKWQNPETILAFFSRLINFSDEYRLIILSRDRDVFNELINLKYSSIAHLIFTKSVNFFDIGYYYAKCDFGIVFRDFSRTNFVSSPTKILEYANCNLRILYSGYIGDFLDKNIESSHLIDCFNYDSQIDLIVQNMTHSLNSSYSSFFYPKTLDNISL